MKTDLTPSSGRNIHYCRSLLHQRDGELTRDLLLSPGDFGLGKVPHGKRPDATTSMVCGYCSTGCGLSIHLKDGEAINLTPTTDHPVNLGMACPKGWEALTVLKSEDRCTTPLIRNQRGKLDPLDWDEALRTFCVRLKALQHRHGKDSIAFLSTGQIPSEEMALLGSLAKFGMGMLHGDGNTRQCMASAVVAYKESFGFDAPPYTYRDFEESDVIFLVGSNLCIAHPIMWQRICRNPHHPEIIVVDPRKTETAMAATEHLALQPKSDLALFYGLAHILIANDWVNTDFVREHTVGFEGFAQHVARFPTDRVSKETGIAQADLLRVAETIHNGQRVSFWWTMGVNQSYEGVRTAQSLINLALLTGNIGRPGTGANSITGQCNAMGSRLFSNTTNLLGGHDFQNPQHREKIADLLGIDASRIPDCNSWSYDQIVEGILRGKIKGLWVIATNTAHSWINQNTLDDILGRLDFLVVQDMYRTTETARRADLILPAAGWGEKEGTFINSERRIGLVKTVAKAPGQALADFQIFKLIAHYWGCADMFAEWTDPESVFQKLKAVTRNQPCDMTGVTDYAFLDERGGIQWPYPEGSTNDTPECRLFGDGRFYHEDGRARFVYEMPRPMLEQPSDKYPYLLLTGRGSASQWHTQTRTSKSPILRQLYPSGVYVEMHPDDARREGVRPNGRVIVESQRGRIVAKSFVTRSVSQGQVFIPMHYAVTNQLTHAHFDPYSKQPSYKDCAVRVRPLANHDPLP